MVAATGWVVSNPAARVFSGDRERFGTAKEFPFVATTYRLTEHFHFWTKHTRIAAVLQPEAFVEISENLARKRGIKNGDLLALQRNSVTINTVTVVDAHEDIFLGRAVGRDDDAYMPQEGDMVVIVPGANPPPPPETKGTPKK